jgi:hypothetical protein
MTSNQKELASKVPVLLLHGDSKFAFSIFNPNEWTGSSRSIVMSCAAQYGLLNHGASQIPLMLKNCEKLCKARFVELQTDWAKAPWELERCYYLVEIPEFHLYAQAYLSTIKTFLDMLAQLVTTEGIVNRKVHGFHKKRNQVGGEFLHILDVKAYSAKRGIASQLRQLVEEHKAVWIDQAIELRDNLVHPERGMYQVTFRLEIELDDERLRLARILPPAIDSQGFGEYAQETMNRIRHFSKLFLYTLKTG